MKFAKMACATSKNIGDEIQSIAAAARLPRVDKVVDREHLASVQGPDPLCVIMNGWFLRGSGWPPSTFVRPIFVGFHVCPNKQDLIARHVDYLRRFEPIGVRDRATAQFLASLGVETEVTYCLTLTFPNRTVTPANGKVIIVDAAEIKLPQSLRRGAIKVAHTLPGMTAATTLKYARELIDFYRDNARLVITTRLHCALPCIAMGIPVVFFADPKDPRIAIVKDIGGIIYNRRLFKRPVLGSTLGTTLNMVDWAPQPIDVTHVKERLLNATEKRMKALKGA